MILFDPAGKSVIAETRKKMRVSKDQVREDRTSALVRVSLFVIDRAASRKHVAEKRRADLKSILYKQKTSIVKFFQFGTRIRETRFPLSCVTLLVEELSALTHLPSVHDRHHA